MKEKIQLIKFFFIDIYGWIRSLFILTFRTIKRPSVFYGYDSYYFACKFADKRTKLWDKKWDQMGKQQGVFPIEDRLLVCSKMELKVYQKRNMMSKKFNPRKVIRKSYYTTKS